jgi:putative FmdB family regulatory protein
MIMQDYRCPVGHVHEALVKMSERADPQACRECDATAERVFLQPANWDWSKQAILSDGPEFDSRFKKLHQDQKVKEERCMAEHGDYGPRPGAD